MALLTLVLALFATGHPGRVNGTYEKSVARLPYIIVYALSEYTGISKDQAELLSGYVAAMQNGSGIFRKGALDQLTDTSQTDSFNIFGWYPFGGAPVDESAQDGLSTEERIRQQEAENGG